MVNVLINNNMHKLHNYNEIVGRDPKDLNKQELISYNYYVESGKIGPDVNNPKYIADFMENKAVEDFKKTRKQVELLSNEIDQIRKELNILEETKQDKIKQLKEYIYALEKTLNSNSYSEAYSILHKVRVFVL